MERCCVETKLGQGTLYVNVNAISQVYIVGDAFVIHYIGGEKTTITKAEGKTILETLYPGK